MGKRVASVVPKIPRHPPKPRIKSEYAGQLPFGGAHLRWPFAPCVLSLNPGLRRRDPAALR